MIVVKVGGSLYDHPRFGPGLRAYLASLAPEKILLVPGGGAFTDAVRQLDAIHQLGEERAHWLALTALWTTAGFCRDLLPGAEFSVHPVADQWDRLAPGTVRVLESHGFCQLNDHLPHTWDVTSDSIAGQAAVVYRATRLILLKSVDVPPGTSWLDAAQEGWVDPFFPSAVADFPATIEMVNFRRWLDETQPRDRSANLRRKFLVHTVPIRYRPQSR